MRTFLHSPAAGSDADENLPHRIVQAKYTIPGTTFVSEDCKVPLQLSNPPQELIP